MKTETFLDKTSWPDRGEWDSEPDKAQWIDEDTGLQCLAVRAVSHWCGYVGVPEGHPAFQKPYDDVDVSCHGGLTYSDLCQGSICHVPEPGQPDHLWWLGFDCAHSGDYRPATTTLTMRINKDHPMPLGYETYRTLGYVKRECAALAAQLKAMGH